MSVALPPLTASRPDARRAAVAFWLVAAVLVVAAVVLNVLVPAMKISFRKQAVDPRQPLKMIQSDLGPWAQVSVDRALDPDTEHELGASQYLMRTYVDTRRIDAAARETLLKSPIDEREKMLGTLHLDDQSVVRFMLTYYTGSVDTVPHVPDRCYVADGFKPSTYEDVAWPVLPRDTDAKKSTRVRLIDFEDQIDSRHAHAVQVAYFFQVNGVYENDPIFGVRKRLQNLFDRQAYFAKIELRTDLESSAAAQGVMTDFLTSAMPDIERVLPDRAAFVKD